MSTICASAHACLWYSGTTLEGERFSGEGLGPVQEVDKLRSRESNDVWQVRLRDTEGALKIRRDAAVLADYAAILVRLGRPEEGIICCQEAEAREPGLYPVAANLGVAFELAGDVRQALRWTTEAIRRNQAAHGGTEWLHVKILEAKLELEVDPLRLARRGVLPDHFGDGGLPLRASLSRVLSRALEFQSRERLSLVDPPDPIVGDLLFELSNAWAVERSIEHALELLRLAELYGVPRGELAERRRSAYVKAIAPSIRHPLHVRVLQITLATAVAVVVIVLFKRVVAALRSR